MQHRTTAAALSALILLVLALAVQPSSAAPANLALRLNGNGRDDIDRVKIAIDAPAAPVDLGGSMTIELWMRATPGENTSGACAPSTTSGDGWITGNVLLDRDIYYDGDYGDYGVALFGAGQIGFGVSRGGAGATICGGTNLDDGAWHHIALTRSDSSATPSGERLQLFVDGVRVAAGAGPLGDISYRDGRATAFPTSDPYLVIGAEKHDAGPAYPSFHGWVDDLRISNVVRYGAAGYARPAGPLPVDAATVALYRFDEGGGTTIVDELGASPGALRYGGTPPGPLWSSEVPFGSSPTAQPTLAPTATPTQPTLAPTATTLLPTATATATTLPPTATPTATTLTNLLGNGDFELDQNGDTRPDSWTTSTSFTRSSASARSGSYSGRHSSTGNVGYMVSQSVPGISAGRGYTLSGWVNIPATSDTFSMQMRVVWRSSSGKTLRTDTIATFSAQTADWASFSRTVTAPSGAASANVQMAVSSLRATIYVDGVRLQ